MISCVKKSRGLRTKWWHLPWWDYTVLPVTRDKWTHPMYMLTMLGYVHLGLFLSVSQLFIAFLFHLLFRAVNKKGLTVWACNQPSGSTQPSTFCGMVKWVSAFGLNGDGGCSFLAACRRAYGSSLSAWSTGRRPSGAVLHLSREPGELSQ